MKYVEKTQSDLPQAQVEKGAEMKLSPAKHYSRAGGPSRLFGWRKPQKPIDGSDIFAGVVSVTIGVMVFTLVCGTVGVAFMKAGTIDPGFVVEVVVLALATPFGIARLLHRIRRGKASDICLKTGEAKDAMRNIADAYKALGLRERWTSYKAFGAAIDAVCAYDADVALRDQAIYTATSRLREISDFERAGISTRHESSRYGYSPAKPGEEDDLESLRTINEVQREFSTSAIVSLSMRFKRVVPATPTPRKQEILADGRSVISGELDTVERLQLITDKADHHTRTALAANA